LIQDAVSRLIGRLFAGGLTEHQAERGHTSIPAAPTCCFLVTLGLTSHCVQSTRRANSSRTV
jgi:hypothetical protein